MASLWNRIFRVFHRWVERSSRDERAVEPRLICSCDVLWESQGRRGEGQLREVSPTGLRLYTDRAVLVGRPIRVFPKPDDELDPRPLEIAVGTVLYSKKRKGRMEIGVRLNFPERFRHHGWLRELRREHTPPRIVPASQAARSAPRLRVVTSRAEYGQIEKGTR